MRILSIVFIILSGYNLCVDFMVCLYIIDVQGIARVINDIIILSFGIYSFRNYDIPGKEQILIKMSVIAFVSSVVSTLIYYIPILTQLETKTIKLLIDFDDILYIALAVFAVVYFLAAYRNFTNKHYH